MRDFTVVAVVLAGLGLTAPAAQAQSRIGAFAGLNVATVVGEGTEDITGKKSRTGLLGGVFAAFALNDRVAIGPEVYYTMKGVKGTEEGTELEVKVDYLEVPLLVTLSFPTEGSVRPFVYAGPAVSFRTKCELSGQMGGISVSFDCDDPEVDARIKKTDMGVVAGGGVRFGPLFVSARYDIGLMNINDEADAGSSEAVRTRAFSVIGGVSVPLGRR
jgi:opacity protein-like surface antigen